MQYVDDVLSFVPHWVIGAVIMIVPAIVVRLLYRWFIGRLIGVAGRVSPFLETLLARGERPVSAILVIFALALALPAARFSGSATILIGEALLTLLILSFGWAAMKALDIGADLYLQRLRTDAGDNLQARKQATQIQILRRTAKTILVIITIAVALMTFPEVRQYGVSLFASAGAAGLIVGFAARPVLSNLLAGIQIALTQPIRVEDAVIVEGEWGWIEKITSTYVVIRIWDLRRLIIPLSYFIEKPFQNWTYEGSQLLGTVYLHVDYTVPVDRLREKLKEIVQASPLWDGKVVVLQVTDAPANMVQLRALASARNAGQAWDLRCEIREKLIAFLQADYPSALPRQRAELAGGLAVAGRPSAAESGGQPEAATTDRPRRSRRGARSEPVPQQAK